MKKRKKTAVILAVIAFIVTAAAAVFYMYLSKWHWVDTVFMPNDVHDPDIYGDDNASVSMSFFHTMLQYTVFRRDILMKNYTMENRRKHRSCIWQVTDPA